MSSANTMADIAAIITPANTAATVEMLRPLLEQLIALPAIARAGAALCVLGPDGDALGDFILGDLSKNPWPNSEIARQKARLSHRCQKPGSAVLPAEKRPEDSEWHGSAWIAGISVGCAGLSEAQDEMLAHWLASALIVGLGSSKTP